MRNLSSQEKLWHTPLVLTVRVQGQPVTIPMDKRSLTVCKHNLQNGHSAELFSEGPLSVVYTRLNTPGSAIIAVRYQNDDIGILAVQGRAFEESLSTDKDTNVHGLTKLAEAIVSRYIDPCSLVRALECSPFLWHPFVSTVLGWPAALVLLGLCVIFFWLSLWLGRPSGRKGRVRHLKRHGER